MDHGLGVRCEHGFNGPCKLRNAGALRHGSFRGSPTLRTTPNLCMRIAEIGNHRHGSGQGEHPHAARAVRQTGRAVGILAGGRRLELPVLQFARGPGQLGFPMSMEANSPRENAVPSNCFRTDRGRRDRSSETSVRPDQSYPQVRKLIVQFPGLPVKFERFTPIHEQVTGKAQIIVPERGAGRNWRQFNYHGSDLEMAASSHFPFAVSARNDTHRCTATKLPVVEDWLESRQRHLALRGGRACARIEGSTTCLTNSLCSDRMLVLGTEESGLGCRERLFGPGWRRHIAGRNACRRRISGMPSCTFRKGRQRSRK